MSFFPAHARRRLTLTLFFSFVFLPAVTVHGMTISDISDADFPGRFSSDVKMLRVMTGNMETTIKKMEESGLFSRERSNDFDLSEKDKVYQLWGNYLDHMLAFEAMTNFHKNCFLIPDRKKHEDSFLLEYASYLAKFSYGLRLIRLTIDNELYEKKLDDQNSEYGIPAGMYARLKWNTIHLQDVSNIAAGYRYFRFLEPSYRKRGLPRDPQTAWLFSYIAEKYGSIRKELKLRGTRYFTANGLDILREKTFAAWFPVQLNVSEWMGDTKVKRKNATLISEKQLAEMERYLMPGDIIVERRNWYLSNVGLPGFWPHAELYIGSYEKMKAYFSDPAVDAYYRKLGPYQNFTDYLGKKYPHKMKSYRGKGGDGHPHEIIEAVSEGVKFSTLPEGALADYIGVLRPRLTKLDIARAIDEAFLYVGRPYDFNFDFLTDSSIVCSELVYKVYKAGDGKRGLDLRLREIAGRMAMPANDLIAKFDREFDSPERELDFVYFLDGSERDLVAAVLPVSEFRKSYKRMKWDIVQE